MRRGARIGDSAASSSKPPRASGAAIACSSIARIRSWISRTARSSRSTCSWPLPGAGGAGSRRDTAPTTTAVVGGTAAPSGGSGGFVPGCGGAGRGSGTGSGTGADAIGASAIGGGRLGAGPTVVAPAADFGAATGAGAAGVVGPSLEAAGAGPPCERRAAAFVISREPQPGHVTMLSGLERGGMPVLQRGQFIVRSTERRVYRRGRSAHGPPPRPRLAARLFGSSPERRLALVRCAWPAAVGPELARRTEVISLDGGQLRVRVPDSAWQRTLFRMRGDILARLRAIAGGAAPRSLGFVQGEVKEEPPPPPAAPAPQAAEPSAALVAAAAGIEDEALRAAFLAAAARYLGRFSSASDAGAATETGSGSAGSSSRSTRG